MAKIISILGSTGSIGTQTLEVVGKLDLKVVGLSAKSNIELLIKQIYEFNPEAVSVDTEEQAEKLEQRLKGREIKVYWGKEGLVKLSTLDSADTVVVSVVGIAGLIPTIEAIKKGKDIALANKETLVTGGSIVMQEIIKNKVKMFPIDSEHSAIFQCLQGNDINQVEKLILTASGGPFRGKTFKEIENVTLEQALNHPNWSMGKKVSIDASTLMNKGFEVIEAKWLFGMNSEKIQVLIHPQSLIHSMVEYADGSIIAQIGARDMRMPIQYALSYPERPENQFKRVDFVKEARFTFEDADYEAFPCLGFAFDALKAGGTMPAVVNGANEIAVELFLAKKITFNDIPRIIDHSMKNHKISNCPDINDILETDNWARSIANEWYDKKR